MMTDDGSGLERPQGGKQRDDWAGNNNYTKFKSPEE